MIEGNERLYRDWQRARRARGYAELPRNHQALASLEAHCDGQDLLGLGRADIQEWLGSLDWMAPSSRLSYFSAVRAFYNFAADPAEAMIGASPMTGMGEPKNPARPVPIPPDDDVRALIAGCERDKTPLGIRDTAIVRVMVDTGGPRASEVAGMLIARRPGAPAGLGLDLDHGDTMTVLGKGGKIRTWPLSARTARACSRWLRAREHVTGAGGPRLWLPFRNPGKLFSRSGVGLVLERRCDAAGIERVHPHQLRHFSYHHFLLAGGKLNDAKLLYGWDDDTMPQKYAMALAAERAIEAGNTLAIGNQW